MSRLIFSIILLSLMFGLASAGTITLTGTCQNQVANGNTIIFTLSSIGNDTAYNLVVTPLFQNVQLTKSNYPIPNLQANANVTLNIGVQSVKQKGTSGGYFVVAYLQGGEPFAAVFPCLINFVNATASQLSIVPYTKLGNNGNVSVRVSVFNEGTNPVKATISLIVPPTFSYIGVNAYTLNFTPYATNNVTFSLIFPNSNQVSYSGGALASYSINNLSYANLASLVLSNQGASKPSFVNLYAGIVAAVVLILLGLILLSFFRKRLKPHE